MSRTLFFLVAVLFGSADAFAVPSAAAMAVAPRTGSISMSTQYGSGAMSAIGKKKNKNSGQSSSLKGYTVGSRAPSASRNRWNSGLPSATAHAARSLPQLAHERKTSNGTRKPFLAAISHVFCV
jgi:hypothetical protein